MIIVVYKVSLLLFSALYAKCTFKSTPVLIIICLRTRFSLAETLVLAGGAIPPAPALPVSAGMPGRVERRVHDTFQP